MEYDEIQILPIIIGLVSVIKRLGVPNKFLPLCSMFFGLIISFTLENNNWKESVLKGLYLGLSSVGLYSSTRSILEGNKEKNEKDI